MQLRAAVLGRIELHVDGHAVAVGGPRQRRLLGMLLVHVGEVVPTYRLIEAVWDGAPPSAAEQTFRSYVARLRRSLDRVGVDGSDVVLTAPSGYSLSSRVEVDAARFEVLLDQARRRLELGDAAAAQRHVEQALDCWQGTAFAEFAGEDWAVAEAIRLEELHLVAHEVALEAAVELGDVDAAIADGRRMVELHPLRERPHHLLMLALHRSGRPAEAIRVGQDYHRRLREDAGLDPSRGIAELEHRILESDPRLERPLTRSIRGYQLGDVLSSSAKAVMHRARRNGKGDQLILIALSEHIADEVRFIHEFELAARTRASTRHAGLVPWHDCWREPGGAYVVTGLPSGGSLGAKLAAPGGPPVGTLGRFVQDLGGALSALHGASLVHGELTADDVWFEHGRPVLIGPVPGLAQRARPDDDVIAIAALVRDLVLRGRLATDELTHGELERLERLLDSAIDGAFGVDLLRLVDEILWLVGAGRNSGATVGVEANPYRGLEPFDERHAPHFFGRTSAVDDIDRKVRRHGFVAVVGPSGSGKSSIVRAGLVPRVRAGGWLTTVMQPGSRPLNELGPALESVSTIEIEPDDDAVRLARTIGDVAGDERLLLVIDQFEELWTVADPEQREALLAALDKLSREEDGRVHVVVTLRADFLGRALGHPVVGALIRDHTVLLAPMTGVELAEAIVEPARAVGVTVETELAAAIVAEAGRNAGSLPLVQFALTELFEQRSHRVMTLDAYRQIGGLGGVIARCAEDTFGRLSPDEQRAAEVALTRLISVDSFGDPTRRRLPNAEIAASASGFVAAFGEARLLTFDRDRSTREQVIEIAHEALAREWPRLRSWVAADQESMVVLRRLSAAAVAWTSGGRDPTDLYRSPRLEVAEEWARAHPGRLTGTETEFLRESRQHADAARRAEQRRTERLRALTIGLAVTLVVIMALGTVALIQRREAVANADEAERRTVEANSQRLSALAVDALGVDPDLAILLALEAVGRSEAAGLRPSAGAVEALHTTTQASRLLARFPQSSVSAMSPSGELAALEVDDDEVVLVDLSTYEHVASAPIDDEITGLWFDPGGDRVAVATATQIVVLDAHDLSTLATAEVECCITSVELHPDRDRIAASFGGDRVRVWTLSGLRAIRTFDGGRIAGWMDDDVVFVDRSGVHRIGSSGVARELGVPIESLLALQVDVHPDGQRLLVADGDGVAMWSTAFPDQLEPVDLDGWGVLFQTVAFDRAGDAILAYGPSDEVRWHPIDGGGSRSLRGHTAVLSVSSGTNGQRVLASGSGETLLWDVSTEGPPELGALAVDGEVWAIEFSDDGRMMYVADQVGGVARARAIDVATRSTLGETEFGAAAGLVHPWMTSTGLAAGWAPNGGSRVEDLTGGEIVTNLGPCEVPAAIDADARWLLIRSDLAGFIEGCESGPGRVLDPGTGDVLLDLPEPIGLADIGPPGTISDGLVAYQVIDPGRPEALIVRDLRTGDLVGRLDGTTAWRPFFSNDGRYLAFGSFSDGGFAVDMQQVLDGGSINDAIVLNPRAAGATSFSLVVGDQLVTGHAGEVLRFWDLADGRTRLQLPVSSGDTTFIAPSPDERHLYYEDEGHLLRRFPVDVDDLVELAERRVQRGFRPSECVRYRLADDCEEFLTSR